VVRLNRRDDGGAIAILVAILATVLFGFAAIVVDLGYARTVEGDAQSAVDAASLAGAGVLSTESNPSAPFDEATKAITTSARSNFGTSPADWDGCVASKPAQLWVQGDIATNCILFNRAVNPTKVQVVLPSKHVDSFFGGLVGYNGMDISARAQATVRQDDVPGCSLCVLGPLDTSGPVAVDGGSDGGSSSAGDNSRVRDGGSITVEDPGAITFTDTPTPTAGAAYSSRPIIRPVTDPFAGSDMPNTDPIYPQPFPDPAATSTVTCGPGGVPALTDGVYRTINVTGPCTATGLIVVTGTTTGLRIRSGGSLTATSAVIQFSCGTRLAPKACPPATSGGRLRIDPNGQLIMSSMIPAQFSIVADPNNKSPMSIRGALSVDHAIYGRSTAVTLQGSGSAVSASGRISIGQLTIGTGGAVTVTAPGGAPVPGPPLVGLFR
jgi:Putative Flp pilus-assembly TadE/G-like